MGKDTSKTAPDPTDRSTTPDVGRLPAHPHLSTRHRRTQGPLLEPAQEATPRPMSPLLGKRHDDRHLLRLRHEYLATW